ncbi:MAG: ABC transporter permease [Spirochaeta sp.]
MSPLLRISLRNLREHRAKTVIIGVLVALGVMLLVVGNSLLATASEGTERVFIENFTGHIMVRTRSDSPVSIAGSSGISMDNYSGTRIPNYREVFQYLQDLEPVENLNPQVPFIARLDYSTPEQNRGAFVPIFGIQPESYQQMFPDVLSLLDGRFLEPGEQGLVLHQIIREQLSDELDIEVAVGDRVKLQSVTQAAGTRIREVPVVGIYEFQVESPSMEGISFLDAHTVRDLAGMVIGTTDVVEIDEADTSLLDLESDFDSLFTEPDQDLGQVSPDNESAPSDPESLFDDLGGSGEESTSFQSYNRIDSGAWSYILLMLEDGDRTEEIITRINTDAEENGWSIEAVGWDDASGGMATFVQAFQVLFLVIVAIITVVSIIIIMNTLVISIVERTAEIGTMRALGAHKSMVRRMFMLETMSIAVVFGVIGLILGMLLLWILSVIGLPAPNPFFEILFGGEVLRPVFALGGVVQGFIMMLGIGIIASLYPVSVALKIQPLQAMKTE